MDLTNSIAPKSDQINAEDLLTGPRTFTIERVTEGNDEQPVDIHLVELPGRAYRPSKTMRRVLVAAWGPEAADYTGRRLTLYRDPEVTFGRDKVGGIKISHLSHIEKRMAIALTVTRGRRSPHVVEPLTESAAQPVSRALPTPEDIAAATDREALQGMWRQFPDGHPARAAIEARVAELDAVPAADDGDPTFPDGGAA